MYKLQDLRWLDTRWTLYTLRITNLRNPFFKYHTTNPLKNVKVSKNKTVLHKILIVNTAFIRALIHSDSVKLMTKQHLHSQPIIFERSLERLPRTTVGSQFISGDNNTHSAPCAAPRRGTLESRYIRELAAYSEKSSDACRACRAISKLRRCRRPRVS